MKKIYCCLVTLSLMTQSTYPDFPAFKAQETGGIKLLIAAAGGLVVGAIGAWKLAYHYYAASQAQIKQWIADEVAEKAAQAKKELEDTKLKELKEGLDTITERVDHLCDVTTKHTFRLQRYKARLDDITRQPETDPIRIAYITRSSPRPRSNSMPPLTPRSDTNDDEDDVLGDFGHLLTGAYAPQISPAQNSVDNYSADDEDEEESPQNLSASAPDQRTQEHVSLLPRLSFSSTYNDIDDEDSDDNYCFTDNIFSTRTGGLSSSALSRLRQSQSEPSVPTPLSPRGIPDEHGKTVYNDSGVIAGRRSKGN